MGRVYLESLMDCQRDWRLMRSLFPELFRRQQGHGRGGRMKIEKDHAEIYTGIRHGKSLGSPIGLILPNKDWKNWTVKMSIDPVETKMKKITLPKILECLEKESNEIIIPNNLLEKARLSVERMTSIGR